MTQSITKWLRYNFAHTQTRLVLILTVSVFLIILTVSLTSYYTSKSVLQEELSEPQRQMLQLNMNVIDDFIKESDQIAIQVALNDNIYRFLTDEVQNSYANISELYQLFSTLISNSKYIKSIYVYDLKKESFVAIPQGYSSSKLNFVDSDWVGVADEFGSEMRIIKQRQLPQGAGGRGSELTLFRKIMIQGKFKGVVAVNLNDEELFAKLNPPVLNNLNRMRYIIDEKDDILYSFSNYDFDEEAVKQALAELREDDSGDITHQNRNLLVNQLVSPVTGWKYISFVVQDSLLAKSKKVRNAVLAVSIAALAIGSVTIFYINAAAFRPVRRLKQLFSAYDGKSQGPEGIDIDLEKLAGELLSNHAQLSKLVRETMSEASSKLLYDMYMGNLSGKREMEEKWSRYFGDWSREPISAAIISIDRYEEWSRTFSGGDQSLLKFAMANIVAELFDSKWRIVCADFGKDKMALLLQPREPGLRPERKLEEWIGLVAKLLKFTVSAGVSTAQTEITQLRQAMLEAENALTYRLYQGYGQLIPFHEVSGHEVRETVTDARMLDELLRMVESGDESGALDAAEKLIADVREQYGYPSSVLLSLRSALERIDRMDQGGEELTQEHTFERLDTLRLEDIGEELSKRVRPLVQRYRRLIESKDFITCHRMIEYMKQHLGETIGIPEIAEEVGISSSLASQIFKQETGETIYNYLTQLRMERAAELLLKSEYKISDIAVMVGYQHENSFIRSFRKFKDITPGKYRDMMRTRMDAMLE